MNNDKQIAFLNKLIEKTKADNIDWKRLPDFDGPKRWGGAKQASSFAAHISSESSIFLLDTSDSDNVICIITPGHGLGPQSFDLNDDTIKSLVYRLYNNVYARFPNIDSILDEFINSP